MPVLITASTEEVGMDLVPEERASARSDEPEARSAARWRVRAAAAARRRVSSSRRWCSSSRRASSRVLRGRRRRR